MRQSEVTDNENVTVGNLDDGEMIFEIRIWEDRIYLAKL